MDSTSDLWLLLLLWLAVATGIILIRWRRAAGGVGIVFAYVFLLAQVHWLPAIFYQLPWYFPAYDPSLVKSGFEESLYGVIAFAAGAVILAPFLTPSGRVDNQHAVDTVLDRRLPKVYLVIGLIGYFVLIPVTMHVPTASAISSGFSQLILAGQVLGCWQAWQARDRGALVRWLALAAIWPFLTTTTQGFIGFGSVMMLAVLVFVIQIVGFRKWFIPVGILAAYLGLSILVTYSQSRDSIRAVVWSDESSLTNRFATISSSLANFQWFDPYNPRDYSFLDLRQNQNFLTGSAMERLANGQVDYASGETIMDAFLMLIPRAIWSDKPISSGGSLLVRQYTTFAVYGSTSIGIGQVLEFYINFGTAGVVVGFFILGALIAVMDEAAARNLRRGDWQRFALWYVPALGLLQPDNTLLSLTVLSAAGWAAIVLANHILLPLLFGKSNQPESVAVAALGVGTVTSLEQSPPNK